MIRVEGDKAYVSTVAEALEVCFVPGVEDVLIEDNAERLKMEKLLKGFAS